MKCFKVLQLKKIFKLSIFFLILTLLLVLSKQNYECVKLSVNLFITSIMPSLFPFILFTEIILKTDILDTVSRIFGKMFSKLFNVSKNSSLAIIIGFICGFPMGAKATNELYKKGNITYNDVVKLLSFVNNCSPAFILSTIGVGIFFNIKIGVILLISHILSAIIIGVIHSKKCLPNTKENDMNSLYILDKKTANIITVNKEKTKLKKSNNPKFQNSFFKILKESILGSFKTLCNILGFIIIFNLAYNIISIFLLNIHLNNNVIKLLSPIFEVTKGSYDIYSLNLALNAKIILISIMLGFSGLCINFQIFSCLTDIPYKFKTLVKNKTIHGILSGITTYILLKLNFIQEATNTVFSNNDYTLQTTSTYYIENIRKSYLVSTFAIICMLIIYYILYKYKIHNKYKI